jgi:hypothetical protein
MLMPYSYYALIAGAAISRAARARSTNLVDEKLSLLPEVIESSPGGALAKVTAGGMKKLSRIL